MSQAPLEAIAQAIAFCIRNRPDEDPVEQAQHLAEELRRLGGDSARCHRHVLVIGGAGYVGSVLIRELLRRGYRVRVLDRLIYGNERSVEGLVGEPGFSFLAGDFGDHGAIDAAIGDDVTDVVLLAALVGDPISRKYPEVTQRVNLEASRRLLDGLHGRRINKLVFTSTCSNYGRSPTEDLLTEEAPLDPRSVYAETKVAFEQHILAHKSALDFSPTILRVSTAYGISHRMRFDLTVSEFVRGLALGERLVVYDKDTWRPYCHVKDISRAIIRVLEAPRELVDGEVFNVGDDRENLTKQMIVELVARHVPVNVEYQAGDKDPRNYRVSFAKIRTRLGFAARHLVGDYVPPLIDAVKGGLYRTAGPTLSHYGNYDVQGL
jgi:nucleoside-diphosphate-sugar epimerase